LQTDDLGFKGYSKNKAANFGISERNSLLKDLQSAKKEILLLLSTINEPMIKLKESDVDDKEKNEQKEKVLKMSTGNDGSLKKIDDQIYDLFIRITKSSVKRGLKTKILVPEHFRIENDQRIKTKSMISNNTDSPASDTLSKFLILANQIEKNEDNNSSPQRSIIKNIEVKFFESPKIKEEARIFLLLSFIVDRSSAYIITTSRTKSKIQRQSAEFESSIQQPDLPHANLTFSTCNNNLDLLCHISSFENLWSQSISYEKVRDQAKMQEEFINVAAHELRTPIQPILLGTDFLCSIIKDPEQIKLLRIINSNAKKLKSLSEDILDVSRIESNTLTINKELVNLNDLIYNIFVEFRNSISRAKSHDQEQEDTDGLDRTCNTNDGYTSGEDGLDNEYESASRKLQFLGKSGEHLEEEDIFVVDADRNRISQVMSNLLTNAAKFTTEEDRITVSITEWKKNDQSYTMNDDSVKPEEIANINNQEKETKGALSNPSTANQRKGKEEENSDTAKNIHPSQCRHFLKNTEQSFAEIQVKDTGNGIEEAMLPRLFTKFASNSYKGIGLGLFISKAIVEAHGGCIWAENNNDGRGCTFHFILPRIIKNKSRQQNALKQKGDHKIQETETKRILIVLEDNTILLKLKEILEGNLGLLSKNNNFKAGTSLISSNNDKESLPINKDIIYTIDNFNDPSIALDKFIIRYYDLIIIDIEFSKMSGFDFCKCIRQKDKKVKVCFLASGETHYKALNNILGFSPMENEQFMDRGDIDNNPDSILEQINAMVLS
jgi:signal transduction histidine kinase/CheY-like chemotaxis protein